MTLLRGSEFGGERGADRGGVASFEVRLTGQRLGPGCGGACWQGEDLVPLPVERDQVRGDERVARLDVLVERHGEDRADRVVSVEAHPVPVSREYEEHIE